MLQTADLIGIPFRDGGRGPESYDCWGLATEVFRRYGIELQDYKISCEDASRINQKMEENRKQWVRCEGVIPIPSLVVIRFGLEFINHVGTYIGNGKFIHTRDKIGVNIDRIDSISWKRKIEGFYTLKEVKHVNINDS